jgi:hypothetical protein
VPSLSRTELLRLARAGAEARINELRSELASILRLFPDLRGRQSSAASRRNSSGAATTRRGRKRRAWSAAQRRAVALRMKKYWAARRAGEKK